MAERANRLLRSAFAQAFGHRPIAEALSTLLAPPAEALPVAPAGDRATWDLEQGTADLPTLRHAVEAARSERGTPWPLPLASTAARVRRDGDRVAHETLVFARQDRLSRACLAAAATLDPRFVDEVADGSWQLCEQSSWCWPAHDDAVRDSGNVLPDVAAPVLDLGASEVAAQLAWIDHLLGEQLDERYPGLRVRIRHEVRGRVLKPMSQKRDWHWLGSARDVHNWNPWIHGNVLVAALRLLDGPRDGATRAAVIARIITGIERYVAALPADGAIDEGYHYWWNGACRALEAFDILSHATAGKLDAIGAVGSLRATLDFPAAMQLGEGWYLNVADGQARESADVAWDAVHRAALTTGNLTAAAHAASHREPGAPVAGDHTSLGRVLRAVTDPAWGAATPGPIELPVRTWFDSIQLRVVREYPSALGLTLVAKGGHNGEHHNHNDLGEVVVACDGVPVLVDAGRPTYTAATFGPDRYELWMMQSGWHSVPLVRGIQQGAGREFHAAAAAPLADGLSLELAGAYPVPGLRSWRREATCSGGQVRVHDSWALEPWVEARPEPPTVLHFLVAGTVTLAGHGAGIVPLEGARVVRVEWPPAVRVTATVRRLDDPMLAGVWGDHLTRLELDVSGRTESTVTLTIEEER